MLGQARVVNCHGEAHTTIHVQGKLVYAITWLNLDPIHATTLTKRMWILQVETCIHTCLLTTTLFPHLYVMSASMGSSEDVIELSDVTVPTWIRP